MFLSAFFQDSIQSPMGWKNIFHDFLKSEFAALKAKNKLYSLRSYARHLGLSPASMSNMMHGQIILRPDRAAKVLEKMNLSQEQKNKLLYLMGREIRIDRTEVEEDQYRILSDWHYLAILYFFDLTLEDKTAAVVARAFDLSETRAREIIDDLTRQGFLEKTATGGLQRRDVHWKTTDGITSEILNRRHKLDAELAKQSIDKFPPDRRDFTSVVFTGNFEQLELIKKEIRQLYARVTALSGDGPKTEVFQLSVNFFPLMNPPEARR